MKTALIGAGLAGTAAARALTEAGHKVFLFDKGRGPGGRLSTRRVETALGQARMDHGAQYVTAQTESFSEFLTDACAHGACEPWKARLVKSVSIAAATLTPYALLSDMSDTQA